MGLTFADGPLGGHRAPTNYTIDGPAHQLFFGDFPRRVRGRFNGETVLDTTAGKFVHETGYLPQLYVPEADLRTELLSPTGHSTHCPFKGDASYRSVVVGDRTAENAVWTYQQPVESASWLRGYAAVYWESLDEWLDEDEVVTGHLRDPYHRVDVRHTSRPVTVRAGDTVIAQADESLLLSETGLPNRSYLPRDAVRVGLEPSDTATVCPYKGDATYWSVRVGNRLITDAAWSYPDPLDDVPGLRDQVCFLHDDLTVEIG